MIMIKFISQLAKASLTCLRDVILKNIISETSVKQLYPIVWINNFYGGFHESNIVTLFWSYEG